MNRDSNSQTPLLQRGEDYGNNYLAIGNDGESRSNGESRSDGESRSNGESRSDGESQENRTYILEDVTRCCENDNESGMEQALEYLSENSKLTIADACNVVTSKIDDVVCTEWSELEIGAHILLDRGIYSHHAIVLGRSNRENFVYVIEFGKNKEGQKMIDVHRKKIHLYNNCKCCCNYCYCCSCFYVREMKYTKCFDAAVTLAIAYSLIGRNSEINYSLFSRNCEHLATFCKTGNWSSEQVENFAWSITRTLVAMNWRAFVVLFVRIILNVFVIPQGWLKDDSDIQSQILAWLLLMELSLFVLEVLCRWFYFCICRDTRPEYWMLPIPCLLQIPLYVFFKKIPVIVVNIPIVFGALQIIDRAGWDKCLSEGDCKIDIRIVSVMVAAYIVGSILGKLLRKTMLVCFNIRCCSCCGIISGGE